MGKILLIVGLSLVVMLDFLLSWILLGLIQKVGIVIVFFVTEAWHWLIKFIIGLRIYDLFWLALVPRIKGFFLVDIWKRIFIKGIAPIIFLDAKNRRLIAQRTAFVSALVIGIVKMMGTSIHMRLERCCGRYTRVVVVGMASLCLGGAIYFTYGIWLLIGLLPLPRWLTRIVVRVMHLLDGVVRSTVFRVAMLLGLVQLWRLVANMVPKQLLEQFLRARRRTVRVLIARRRLATQRLSRVTWWERAVASWVAFWNTAYDQLVARTHRYQSTQKTHKT